MLMQMQKQELLSKHAKKFAADKKENVRTQFQGIHYAENGAAYVSDTYCLLRIKDVHSFTEPHTLHATTGAELKAEYPSVNSLNRLLTVEPLNSIFLDAAFVEIATRNCAIALNIVKALSPKYRSERCIFLVGGDFAWLEIKGIKGIWFKAPIGAMTASCDEKWLLDAEYLFNAFNLFKDAGTAALTIKLAGKNSSILLSDEENGIDVLIALIRQPENEE